MKDPVTRWVASFLFVLVLSLSTMSIPKVSAFEVRTNRNLEKTEVITGDFFVSGENVTVAGTINGNLFVAGANIMVSGYVQGNVFAAGSTIQITGDVGKSVYAAASSIDLEGNSGRDVFIAAGQVTVGGKVAENVFATGGTLLYKNDIKENLYTSGGQISLLGTVGKDAFISGGSVAADQSQVKGKLSVQIQEPPKQPAVDQEQKEAGKKLIAGLSAGAIMFKMVWFTGMFLLGLLIIKLFPKFTVGVETEIVTSFAKNVGIGLLVYLATPLAVILLCVTVIGFPLALASIMVLSLVMFITSILGGKALGQYVFKLAKQKSSWVLELFVGQLLLALICMVPFLGFFVKLVLNGVVLGAVVSAQKKCC
ncbi:hypothetical protein COX64_03600 [Candidatus Dojkabacteria bacterium CG_4_10_14_0_2_um_filter_Dojkabacteria_WS6_41_15]|uniref:DUF8173 domain-containing protein n=1 Tax=Candidatus Dojkabacteria bacterium CG_4_10_14_0_2_um_filter_Dojkabacteria_WS6_41_15 TaxID=2014249 RepID=A0A2M7W1C9_9BACT|nr:MAG: hypothetical protein COX64_03600 [Candidatus Dojkabacteria bacterium CG_4_10_14_0_2_um_filter_Dojkabacteria_WS6_41_15]